MELYNYTNYILKKYKLSPKKFYGQNFLINESIIEKIIEVAEIGKEDTIIEVGPGLGVLTEKLLENAGAVIAIEIDKELCSMLEDRFKDYNNFYLINEDVLKVDIKEILKKLKVNTESVKLVANIPYYITTDILIKALDEKTVKEVYIMIQKEVAERICANTGERKAGAITYYIEYGCDANIEFNVSKENFKPIPKIDSAVVSLKKREKKEYSYSKDIMELTFLIIKQAFKMRRKTLINGIIRDPKNIYKKEDILEGLEFLGINKSIRGENLTLEEYFKLAEFLKTKENGEINNE